MVTLSPAFCDSFQTSSALVNKSISEFCTIYFCDLQTFQRITHTHLKFCYAGTYYGDLIHMTTIFV